MGRERVGGDRSPRQDRAEAGGRQALQTLVARAPRLHEFRNLRPVVSADVDADRYRAQQRAGRVRYQGFDEFSQVLPKLGVAGVAMEAAVVERPSAQAIPFALVGEPPEFVTSPSLHLGRR